MTIQFTKSKWLQDSEGGLWLSLKVTVPNLAKEFVSGMQDKLYDAKLQLHREKRSLDANALLWVLCQKISEAVRNITKEEVYQEAVRQVGQFEFLPIRNDAVDTFISRWSYKGLGWFAEKVDDSKLDGYTKVIAYYGSSVYDTREMSVLLDYIVNEAKDLDIETAPPEEIERIKSLWQQDKH